MNLVVLTGYLGRDPELREANGRKYVRLRLGANGGKTAWVDVVAFDRLAEQCAGLKKGQKVAVLGRLENDRRGRLAVIAREVEFVRPKKEKEEAPPEEPEIPDDDLPF